MLGRNHLHVYTVWRHPDKPGVEDAVLIKEHFNFFAFLFTWGWALYHKLWVPALLLFIAQQAAIAYLIDTVLPGLAAPLLALLLNVVAGLFGQDWRAARLRRKGYALSDIATGDSDIRAQQRFFERAMA